MKLSVSLSVALQVVTNHQRATAFQTPQRKVHRRQHSSSDLFLSSHSVARSIPDDSSKNGLLKGRTSKDRSIVDTVDRPTLSKTIPSGQKQLPVHIRIAKVSQSLSCKQGNNIMIYDLLSNISISTRCTISKPAKLNLNYIGNLRRIVTMVNISVSPHRSVTGPTKFGSTHGSHWCRTFIFLLLH